MPASPCGRTDELQDNKIPACKGEHGDAFIGSRIPLSAAKPAVAKPAKIPAVFAALKGILEPYVKASPCSPLQAGILLSCNSSVRPQGEAAWFAAIRMGKNYVSYHLMPVYMNPALQKHISPELKKRMQGKACFNFSEVDPALFRQLTELTATGFEGYRTLKYV